MSLSLPADPPRARSLTGVVPQMMAAMDGTSDWLAPARSAIVFVIDGLGAHNLKERAGHARFLSSAAAKKDAVRTVFPSTTASALTSLLTGVAPGEHGIVGYRVLVPQLDEVVNQLRGWDTDGLDLAWQRAEPLTERYAAAGRPCFVVSKREYAGTGFTSAIMRGAEFVAAEDVAERPQIAADLAARHPGAFVYIYAPDLDALGHKRGWQSDEWVSALERVDAAAARLAGALAPGTGAVVTADHGMVDVPRHRHVLLSDGDVLVDGVRHIGGEPRMLHLMRSRSAADVLARLAGGRIGAILGAVARARRSTPDCSAPWRRRSCRASATSSSPRVRHRVLRRSTRGQGRPADGRPARLAHRRGAQRAAHPARARSPDAWLTPRCAPRRRSRPTTASRCDPFGDLLPRRPRPDPTPLWGSSGKSSRGASS